jgi:hypothetical protein
MTYAVTQWSPVSRLWTQFEDLLESVDLGELQS